MPVSRSGVALALIAGSALVGPSTWSGPASAAPQVRPVTVRVSVRSGGGQAEGGSSSSVLSGTGRYVAFTSSASDLVPGDANGVDDVFVRDRRRGTTRLVSVSSQEARANGPSFVLGISANGRYVAFESDASNLVPRDTNRRPDIFVRDRR